MPSNGRTLNPFDSPAASSIELSERASVNSDYSVNSDMGLAPNMSSSHADAFRQAHDDHVHNSRNGVFTSSSSVSSRSSASGSSSAVYDRYPSDARLSVNQSSIYDASRNSSTSVVYPHNLGDPTSVNSNGPADPDFSPFGGYPVSSFPLHIDEKEPDDYLHNPDPILDAKDHRSFFDFDARGVSNLITLFCLVAGAVCLFIVLPVLTYTGATERHTVTVVDSSLTSYTYGTLGAIRTSLIDPDTPTDAYTRTDKNGNTLYLAFSDEFNQEGRTFYEDEDQFWYAADLHYAATEDLEYYDPDAVTTRDGVLVLRMDAFKNHDLDYRSGMLHSWNKLCFSGGLFEASVSLPGTGDKPGLWPGVWTMGNLGRPGYLATTDGTWPYSYEECDAGITPNQSSTDGISWLSGQRLNSCTCKGYEHPNQGTGRAAPEIDALEGSVASYNTTNKVGVASQSFQIAPFDLWYLADYSYLEVYNDSITSMNTWAGGPYQQAVSAFTTLNTEWYGGKSYQTYGYEYDPFISDPYIQWQVGGEGTFTLYSNALRQNGNVGRRIVPKEPMSIILNFGLSNSWIYIDWPALSFPMEMYIDYVRIYQRDDGKSSITCDPDGYPTTDYISDHPKAYLNHNMTKWYHAGYTWPKNTLMDGCSM
ncbi:glucan synthase subunit [Myxozyma melibiosi]|uniref:Glucan synthase subunit n=1 Tax=Myxozyma melibiosi TaxID=54550 RepID=A0ABR1F6U4_9ASCO